MAEYEEDFNEDGFPSDEELNEEDYESDPATVAFLDQAGAEFQAQREQFQQMYGFDHDCHCAQDYAEGRLAQVTQCYLGLTDDALETSARLNWENQTLQGMVESLVQMNDDLLTALKDAGVEADPDEFLQNALLKTMEDGPDPASIDREEELNGETSELS